MRLKARSIPALAGMLGVLAAVGCVHQHVPTASSPAPASPSGPPGPTPQSSIPAAPAGVFTQPGTGPEAPGNAPPPDGGAAHDAVREPTQPNSAAPANGSARSPRTAQRSSSPAASGSEASATTGATRRSTPARTGPPGASSAGTAASPGAAAQASTAAAAATLKPTGPPPLDVAGLTQKLKDTRAIGLFTKLSLKNQVDDLLGAFRGFHAGHLPPTLPDLRERYDLLLMKVLSLLQDGDPPLAASIRASREALWGLLADPNQFRRLQAQ